jgi:hypothetical protein
MDDKDSVFLLKRSFKAALAAEQQGAVHVRQPAAATSKPPK